MNKLFATLLLFIASLNLQAQDSYIKFLKDTELQGKKFFKGEIYSTVTSPDAKFPFYFSAEGEILGIGKNVQKVQINPDDKTSLKDNFIKSKDNGFIHIDVSSVSTGNDTIRFVSEKFEVTPIVKNKTIDLELAKVGNSFHLIIPNSPTIYYSLSELTKFTEQSSSSLETNIDSDQNSSEFKTTENSGYHREGMAWWQYALIVLGVGGIGIGIWKFVKGRKKNRKNLFASMVVH
ncbi:MAG: hypothetical protein M0D53_01090 [Flavobacterium sp. JAD_PAG50586_2]|nr:MAG: hypothetical protein M0D53_01090 [Flavobacterium sp. JAD_PAG50586_2]